MKRINKKGYQYYFQKPKQWIRKKEMVIILLIEYLIPIKQEVLIMNSQYIMIKNEKHLTIKRKLKIY